MKYNTKWLAAAVAIASGLAIINPAVANTTINSFDSFTSDALYGSWSTPAATIVSGPTSYMVSSYGWGSNWKYNPVDGSGNATVQLTVSLSGGPTADGQLGPVITLVDGDGTRFNYAWYGQTLGSHVLTMPLDSPTWSDGAGTTPGLDLATLTHLHMGLDPGGYADQYTVAWEDLSVIPEPTSLALIALGVAGLSIARRRTE